jgi:hypothetical protein
MISKADLFVKSSAKSNQSSISDIFGGTRYDPGEKVLENNDDILKNDKLKLGITNRLLFQNYVQL